MLRLILSIIFITLVYGDRNCPPGYTSSDEVLCYKVYTALRTRTLAEAQCEADGGYLATPWNAFNNALFVDLIKNASNYGSTWIGVQCFNGNLDNCGNDDNSAFIYNNFPTNFGEHSNNSHCVSILYMPNTVGYWFTTDCMGKHSYICAVKYGSYTPCPPAYSAFNGTCYKVVGQKMNVLQAENYCKNVTGGNLAAIPNVEVNDFLYDLGVSYTDYTYRDSYLIGVVCPNVVSSYDTSSCYWMDGTTFDYENFQSNSPRLGNPYTLLDTSNRGWSSQDGTGVYPFICEAPPLQ